MGIDEINVAQVPARVAEVEPREMAVAARDLKAAAVEGDGPIALALDAGDRGAKGVAQLIA